MPGIANILYALSGQPDPERQIALALQGQQQAQQGGPGQGPAPPNAPPGPGGAAAAGQNAAPAPPEPAAYQSSQDLAAGYQQLANPPNLLSLYAQLDARNRASDQINRGFALMASHWASPEGKRAIMESVGAAPDAGQQVGNLMNIYSAQQGMAARQQELASAPDIAAKTGLPLSYVQGEIAAGRGGELMRGMEPTETAKNYAWAHKTYADAHPGATPDEIEEGAQGILMGMGGMGGGDASTRSWRAAKIQWDQNEATKGTPYPWGVGADDNPTSFVNWQATTKAKEGRQAEDQQDALDKFPTYHQNLTGLAKNITDIIGLKEGGNPDNPQDYNQAKIDLLQRTLANPIAIDYLSADPGKRRLANILDMPQDQQAVLRAIADTTDPAQMIGGLNKRAPKRGVSDVNDISAGLSTLRDVTRPADEWLSAAVHTLKAVHTADSNAFGASGQAEQAPENIAELMDDSYLYGGGNYPKGKRPLPMPPDQIDKAAAAIKAAKDPEEERQRQIKIARVRNFDPAPLKNLRQ